MIKEEKNEKEEKAEDIKISDQQTQTDHRIEEILPKELCCPICGARAIQVTTKRGIHYKCQNEDCSWDSNRPFDFSKEKRRKNVMHAASILKKMIPEINVVENFGYSPEIIFTGEKKDSATKYDLSVYFMGMKLQRVRVEINNGLTKKEFFDSNYCYVIGRPEVVEYLAKRNGLVAHLLIDEETEKLGISRMDQIVKICPMKKDHFGNQQYFIEKTYRPALVTFDVDEIKNLLFTNLYKKLYRNLVIK